MKITVMSRQEAIAHSYKKDVNKYIIVSICCPDDTGPIFYTPSKLKDIKRKGILRLWFNDIDRPYENKEPKQEDFVGLKAFIDKFKNDSITQYKVYFIYKDIEILAKKDKRKIMQYINI